MRTYWLALLILLPFTACVDLGFREAQPLSGSDLNEFPPELIGTFANKEDTIIVRPRMLISGNDSTSVAFSDTVKLRQMQDWYFLNITESDQDYWTVVCARVKGGKLVIRIPEIDKEDKARLSKYGEVEEVYSQLNNLSAYIIDPAEEDWPKLMKSKLFKATKLRKISP